MKMMEIISTLLFKTFNFMPNLLAYSSIVIIFHWFGFWDRFITYSIIASSDIPRILCKLINCVPTCTYQYYYLQMEGELGPEKTTASALLPVPAALVPDPAAPLPVTNAPSPDPAAPSLDRVATLPDPAAPSPERAAPLPDFAAPVTETAALPPDQAAPLPAPAATLPDPTTPLLAPAAPLSNPNPDGYGNVLHPYSIESGMNLKEMESELTKISIERQLNERDSIIQMKGVDYLAFRRKHDNSFLYCSICSESITWPRPYMKPVYHKHGSSQAYRANAPLDSWGSYLCTSCRVTPHRVNSGARTPVLVSSSTMHCWQGRRYINNYPGDDLHMDVCTIPGATVRTLKHGLLSEYGACYRPLDILCVFGLNDLLAGRSVQQIVDDMRDFQSTVHRLTPPNATNSIKGE